MIRLCLRFVMAMSIFSAGSLALGQTFPAATVINVKSPPYGAKGDSVTDDLAAILKAIKAGINKNNATFKTIYLPNGIYKVTGSIEWKDSSNQWAKGLTLAGQSKEGTIIRLSDNCPGFSDSTGNYGKPVIRTADSKVDGEGVDAFMNYVQNLTVDIGRNNLRAIGIDFVGSNAAGVRNVNIKTSDDSGRGLAGLGCSRNFIGPCFFKGISITGFDYGILAEYLTSVSVSTTASLTFEHI